MSFRLDHTSKYLHDQFKVNICIVSDPFIDVCTKSIEINPLRQGLLVFIYNKYNSFIVYLPAL